MKYYTNDTAEKQKALKKLMRKWLTTEATERKATLLLEKNPSLKPRKASGNSASK